MEIEFFEHDKNRLTSEQLRKYSGLEHLTDEEALKSIETFEKPASILFESHSRRKNIS